LPKNRKLKKHKPVVALSPEDQAHLGHLLNDMGNLNPSELVKHVPSPPVAEALAENLPLGEPKTLEIISAIRNAFPQKSVQKAVKKTLFKLKQMGITLKEEEPDTGPVVEAKTEEPAAYIGPIDGAGNRPLLLSVPHGTAGVEVAMGAVNDEQGILDFVYGTYSRKRMKEVKEIFFSKVPHMVETTLSHVATVLELAYRQGQGKSSPPAEEYLRLRPWLLENVKLLDHPPAEEAIPLESLSADILTETLVKRLLSHDLLASWVIDPKKLKPLMEEIKRAEESPIFISETQRREHINRIMEEGIDKVFDSNARDTVRKRLEETAYVFFKLGEETLARLSLAASLSLKEKQSLLKVNPLLKSLLDRSLSSRFSKPPRSSNLALP
jgi:hypothetical protein